MMRWLCPHKWRVIAETFNKGRQMKDITGRVDSWELSFSDEITLLRAMVDTTTVLVACDDCGAKEEHYMSGKSTYAEEEESS